VSEHSFRLSDKAETLRQQFFIENGLLSETETENWEKLFVEVLQSLNINKSSPPASDAEIEQYSKTLPPEIR
jgi:hypothetical protein